MVRFFIEKYFLTNLLKSDREHWFIFNFILINYLNSFSAG